MNAQSLHFQVQRTKTFVAYVDGEERKVQRTATFDFFGGLLSLACFMQ